jgi:hypothetical protein
MLLSSSSIAWFCWHLLARQSLVKKNLWEGKKVLHLSLCILLMVRRISYWEISPARKHEDFSWRSTKGIWDKSREGSAQS